jgi:hypothetical protein
MASSVQSENFANLRSDSFAHAGEPRASIPVIGRGSRSAQPYELRRDHDDL